MVPIANEETGLRSIASCEMFNAGDSGFSEFPSPATSEDENFTNDAPATRYVILYFISVEFCV